MTFGRFELCDIRQVWDAIKPFVEEIQGLGMDWKPEDVYAQCLMGRAFCYTCKDGFVIVQPQENPYTLDKELFVWLCYSMADDGLETYREDIALIAKSIHATSIIFRSPREGFRRVAKQNGWQCVSEYKIAI